jgi:hypothetical protein
MAKKVRLKVPSVRDAQNLVIQERSDVPFAAALIGAGSGAFALGVLTMVAEATGSGGNLYVLGMPITWLGTRTLLSTGTFFLAWFVLSRALRGREDVLTKATIVASVLFILGLLGTFPPLFELLSRD